MPRWKFWERGEEESTPEEVEQQRLYAEASARAKAEAEAKLAEERAAVPPPKPPEPPRLTVVEESRFEPDEGGITRLQLEAERKARGLNLTGEFHDLLETMAGLPLGEQWNALRDFMTKLEDVETKRELVKSAEEEQKMRLGEEQIRKVEEEVRKLQEQTRKERQYGTAAQIGAAGAVVHTGFFAAGKGAGASGKVARTAARAIIPPTLKTKEEREARREFYLPRAAPGLYGGRVPTREGRILAGEALTPSLEPLRRGLPLTGLREATTPRMAPSRGDGLDRLRQAMTVTSPLAQLVTGVRPTPTPTPTPTVTPTITTRTVPTRTTGMQVRPEQPMPTQLAKYVEQKGYEPVEAVGMPAYFWIGVKQGAEPSSNAWVIRLRTGRYGLAGIGDVTHRPRSKISYSTVEEAIDAASDVPGGNYTD